MEAWRAPSACRRAGAASRLLSGSSNRNTLGCRTMARPMATRWRWPPDSCPGLRFSSSSMWRIFAAARARSAISAPGRRRSTWAEGHVVEHRLMRIERVGLEHHGDAAPRRLDIVDHCPVDRRCRRWLRHRARRSCAAAWTCRSPRGRQTPRSSPLAISEVDALDHIDIAERFLDVTQRQRGHAGPSWCERSPPPGLANRTAGRWSMIGRQQVARGLR